MATHIVVRPFSESGKRLQPGLIVDASSWPNVKLLLDQGYLAEVPAKPPCPPKQKTSKT
jgi:hypothetical protein